MRNKRMRKFGTLFFTIIFIMASFTNIVFASENTDSVVSKTATNRILFEDDFATNDGAKWDISCGNNATIRFTDGKVNVKGGGPENRISTRAQIGATDFAIDLDAWFNEGNINCAFKIGFKSDAQCLNRYQVTYDAVNKCLAFEKVVNGAVQRLKSTKLGMVNLTPKADDSPYHFNIQVKGSIVHVLIDGESVLTAVDEDMQTITHGHFLIASQYPKQDYSVDNVMITTDKIPDGQEYTITLKTKTDGIEDIPGEQIGGSLTADRLSGYAGDTVTLHAKAKRGYQFVGYESYLENGNSTDGLLTIEDNQFQIDDKTGSVTIVACFEKKPKDPNLFFEDDFEEGLNDFNQYDEIYDTKSAIVKNGKLTLSSSKDGSPNYLLASGEEWDIDEANGEGYSISFDVKKANNQAGTIQVAFRLNGFSQRYVLALNGDKALLRRFDTGVNHELKSVLYRLDSTTRRIKITVQKGTVSVTSNGEPVISYENIDSGKDNANWSNVSPGLALINMTQGAPIQFDNVKVEKVVPVYPINCKVTLDGKTDDEYLSGTITAKPAMASAGEVVKLAVMSKAGYQLESLKVDGKTISEKQFTMPSIIGDDGIMVTANFVKDIRSREPKTFYIDSVAGNDNNIGTKPDKPWKSLRKISEMTIIPGDTILLKAGSVFNGEDAHLTFKGSGTAQAPIRIASYGEGARPCLNGQGEVTDVISLYNQEYIIIEDLEITNLHPKYSSDFKLNSSNNRQIPLRAVHVIAKDYGVVHSVHLKNLYIHDINGNLAMKWNGGIFFDIEADVVEGKLTGIPTKYDDVLIEGCKFERVDRSAIKLVSSAWANQSLQNNPRIPLNWYPSTNIVVRSNSLSQIGGDGITVRDTEGALIEYNVAKDCRYQNTGYNAGIWPFQASNTVVQYNEVYRTHGVQDGQGFDCDHLSMYTVMQYNYSHDNEGGFMLIMNGFPHTAPTIRYNISQNDKDKTFEFARGTPAGTMIYNNTIYSDSVLTGRGGVFDMANTRAGTGNREVFAFNNIFYYPEGQAFYCGEINNIKEKINLYNNAYYGGITPPEEEIKAIIEDPKLVRVGSGPSENTTDIPVTGEHLKGELDGYLLQEDSPLIEAGVTIEDVLEEYSGIQTDCRSLSPVEIHEQAKLGDSIDFVADKYLPEITGVKYKTDFFGTELPGEGQKPSIGAAEFTLEEPKSEEPEEPKSEEPKEPKSEEPKEPKSEEPKEPKPEEPEAPKPEEPEAPKPEEPEAPKPEKPEESKPKEPKLEELEQTEDKKSGSRESDVSTEKDVVSPATGDYMPIKLLCVLILLCAIVLVSISVSKLKKQR